MALKQIRLTQTAVFTVKSSIQYFKAKRYNKMLRLQKGDISIKDDKFLQMLKRKNDDEESQSLNSSTLSDACSIDHKNYDYFTRCLNQIKAMGTITDQ